MSKIITRKYIQRITKREGDTSIRRNSGGGGGGGGVSQYWVDDNYVSKEFFNRLFEIHDENGDPILPNDVETEIDNIQAMFGFWTNAYLSALGQNEGGGGAELTLASLADVAVQGVTDGQALVWNAAQGKWVPGQGGGGLDPTAMWAELASTGTQQISKTHLTTALADYLPLAGGTMTNTNLVTNLNAQYLNGYGAYDGTNSGYVFINDHNFCEMGTHIEFHYDKTSGLDYSTVLRCTGNHRNRVSLPSGSGTLALTTDNVASATKLQTARTIWGQSFDGTANVSGAITDATTITASSNVSVGGTLSVTGAATLSSTLGVSGVLTASGGITIPSGKTLTIGDAVLSWDSTNQAVKITKGFYSETFISALGAGSGGESGGVTLEQVWTALGNATNEQINASHLTTALTGYATQSYATQAADNALADAKTWVQQQGYLTSSAISDMATQTWVGNNYLPLSGGIVSGLLTLSPSQATGSQDGLVLHDNGGGANEGLRIRWTSASYSTGVYLTGHPDTGLLDINGETVATRTWVGQNYISIAFFNRLFKAYNNNTEVSANDTTSTIDNIKAMFGFWTNSYLSALGSNPGGASLTLSSLSDVSISGATAGQVLTYRNGAWRNETPQGGGGSVTSIVTGGTTYSPTNGVVTLPDYIIYTDDGNQYLNASFLKAEYSQKAAQKYIEFWDSTGGWFNFRLGTLYAISDVKVGNNSVIHAGNIGSQSVSYATTAGSVNKLQTARTIWGQSFDGTSNVSGSMMGVTSIEMNSDGALSSFGGFIDFHYGGSSADYTSRIIENASGRIAINDILYVKTNGTVGIGTDSPSTSYKLDVNGDGRMGHLTIGLDNDNVKGKISPLYFSSSGGGMAEGTAVKITPDLTNTNVWFAFRRAVNSSSQPAAYLYTSLENSAINTLQINKADSTTYNFHVGQGFVNKAGATTLWGYRIDFKSRLNGTGSSLTYMTIKNDGNVYSAAKASAASMTNRSKVKPCALWMVMAQARRKG